MSRNDLDDEATAIFCEVAARLHAARATPPNHCPTLSAWFRDLEISAQNDGGVFARCWAVAQGLLKAPQDVTLLHGDIHHGNVLDFGSERGWLAIDPKGLKGERAFDYANIFTNPDLADPSQLIATNPTFFAKRLAIVSKSASIDAKRMLAWILA